MSEFTSADKSGMRELMRRHPSTDEPMIDELLHIEAIGLIVKDAHKTNHISAKARTFNLYVEFIAFEILVKCFRDNIAVEEEFVVEPISRYDTLNYVLMDKKELFKTMKQLVQLSYLMWCTFFDLCSSVPFGHN